MQAKDSKRIRAEPIATLYAQNKVYHVPYYNNIIENGLIDLENEMLSFTGNKGQKSPDRLDALVYALQHIVETQTKKRDWGKEIFTLDWC